MLFDYAFGNSYEIQSIKAPLFDIMNASLYSKLKKKQIDMHKLKKIQEILQQGIVEMIH